MLRGHLPMSWNVPAIANGDPEGFANFLKANNFDSVCLKAANGNLKQLVAKSSPWPNWGENIRHALISALKAAKIKIYLWHFLYGTDPRGELDRAIEQTEAFKPDGYIWDPEGAFDAKPNAVANARLISGGYRQRFPNMDQGLCWWALPKSPTTGVVWHPIEVANAFLETCDVGMPMAYWSGMGSNAALSYLKNSIRIWRTFTQKPLIPVGRAYIGNEGTADAPGILAFSGHVLSQSKVDNLIGLSWWVLDNAIEKPEWMLALKSIPSFPVYLTEEEKLSRLVAAHPGLFPELV